MSDPNTYPTITYDIRLGEMVDYIYCKPRLIAELMSQQGVCAEAIAATNIHLSTDYIESNDGKHSMWGEYSNPTQTMTLYLGAGNDVINKIAQDTPEYLKTAKDKRMLADFLNDQYNDAQLHELKHAIDYNVLADESWQADRHAHHQEKVVKRIRKGQVLGAAGGFTGFGTVGYIFTTGNREFLEYAGLPVMAAAVGLLVMANVHQGRALSTSINHKDYLDMPWEERARNFAAEQLEISKAKNRLPLNVKYKLLRTY